MLLTGAIGQGCRPESEMENILFKIKYLFGLSAMAVAGYAFAQPAAVQVPPPAIAPAAPRVEAAPPPLRAPLKPCTSLRVDEPSNVTMGKSTVIRLATPAQRMVVGGRPTSRTGPIPQATGAAGPTPTQTGLQQLQDGIAEVDVMLLSPTELYIIGRRAGSMNVVLQGSDDGCLVKDVIVTMDSSTLQRKLAELLPSENGIRVTSAETSLVLEGTVTDSIKLDQAMTLAAAYADNKKIVNMLRVGSPQQVMLEVQIAEVSKTLLDKLGAEIGLARTISGLGYSLGSSFLANGGAILQALKVGKTLVRVDGQKDDGLVRLLAEPNIMAISGQRASFLSGGKIFIPVAYNNNALSGIPTITLEEKEFGVGVKFTPTVLNGSRINLKLVSEVSELSQTGNPFTSVNGVTAVLPSFTVRRADTTVELNDGQSLVVAGLIKNDVTETVKRFPGLGEIPVLGALFRSTEFQTGQTELLFVITPRLVKPLAEPPRLPTDNHVVPSRAERYLDGRLESSTPPTAPPARAEGFAPPPGPSKDPATEVR